jgi:hypothetical protein
MNVTVAFPTSGANSFTEGMDKCQQTGAGERSQCLQSGTVVEKVTGALHDLADCHQRKESGP